MKLSEWRRQFADKYRQYIDELSRLGVDTATRIYSESDPRYGNNDVTVDREFDGGVDFVIRASGKSAPFLEFGAGVTAGVRRPTVQADYEIAPGSWSEEHNGEFSKYGYWHYNGEKLYGTPALGGLQEACNVMEQQSKDIARMVFG